MTRTSVSAIARCRARPAAPPGSSDEKFAALSNHISRHSVTFLSAVGTSDEPRAGVPRTQREGSPGAREPARGRWSGGPASSARILFRGLPKEGKRATTMTVRKGGNIRPAGPVRLRSRKSHPLEDLWHAAEVLLPHHKQRLHAIVRYSDGTIFRRSLSTISALPGFCRTKVVLSAEIASGGARSIDGHGGFACRKYTLPLDGDPALPYDGFRRAWPSRKFSEEKKKQTPAQKPINLR
jgi:hypothetical protein